MRDTRSDSTYTARGARPPERELRAVGDLEDPRRGVLAVDHEHGTRGRARGPLVGGQRVGGGQLRLVGHAAGDQEAVGFGRDAVALADVGERIRARLVVPARHHVLLFDAVLVPARVAVGLPARPRGERRGRAGDPAERPLGHAIREADRGVVADEHRDARLLQLAPHHDEVRPAAVVHAVVLGGTPGRRLSHEAIARAAARDCRAVARGTALGADALAGEAVTRELVVAPPVVASDVGKSCSSRPARTGRSLRSARRACTGTSPGSTRCEHEQREHGSRSRGGRHVIDCIEPRWG